MALNKNYFFLDGGIFFLFLFDHTILTSHFPFSFSFLLSSLLYHLFTSTPNVPCLFSFYGNISAQTFRQFYCFNLLLFCIPYLSLQSFICLFIYLLLLFFKADIIMTCLFRSIKHALLNKY